MSRTVMIELLPGETEVHVTIKAAPLPPPVVQRPKNYSETEKIATAHMAELCSFLYAVCGNELCDLKSMGDKLRRLIGRPAARPKGDPVFERALLVRALMHDRHRQDWSAEVIAAVQANLGRLTEYAALLNSPEMTAEAARLKGIFVMDYTKK